MTSTDLKIITFIGVLYVLAGGYLVASIERQGGSGTVVAVVASALFAATIWLALKVRK